ncbi:MAG: Uma2 family endonuclease [Anaerolineae bacterium]|nr:Uma2 family endonuclease [Anaerolineae bacterium]
MVAATQRITVEEFERLASRPANVDRRLEFIAGEVVELVPHQYCSQIAGRIIVRLGAFVEQHNLGYYSVPDGGFKIGDNRVMPDVAFVSNTRQTTPSHETWASVVPDLAIEIISPSDRVKDVTNKIAIYLAAGVTVWLIDPEDHTLTIHKSGEAPQTWGPDDGVHGEDQLAGFTLVIKDIFPE